MNYIVFDIETYSPTDAQKINTSELKVTVAGAYFSWLDKYLGFFEDDINQLIEAFKYADLIVGYNHLGFDLPVLQKYSSYSLKDLPNYDILNQVESTVGFRLRLDDLCKATFEDDVKTDTYAKYKNYHKENKWAELLDYCMNDVRLTNQLFQLILNDQPLHYFDLLKRESMVLAKPNLQALSKIQEEDTIF